MLNAHKLNLILMTIEQTLQTEIEESKRWLDLETIQST
jgi:hypothetical protein